MRVGYSRDVETDLDEIAAYMAADSPRRAVSFIRKIRAEIDRIGREPLLYQLRPDIGEGPAGRGRPLCDPVLDRR